MGTPHKSLRTNRRGRKPVNNETERGSKTSDWRQVVRHCCDGIHVRGSPRVVLSSDSGTTTDEKKNCATSQRIQHVERSYSFDLTQVPDSDNDGSVLLSRRPSESTRDDCLPRMQSLSIRRKVFFDPDCITVFTPSDWPAEDYCDARKGQWMQIACDRFRFIRRIEQTELLLLNIFSKDHRERYLVGC